MRNAFADEVTKLAAKNDKVLLLSGDIGNRLFDHFKAQRPQHFVNCGVAEANMVSMAAGLAMSGYRPITYTINSFTTYRCLEQIRIDACYHNLPVIIVGVGSGLGYAALGGTHHSLEDIAMLRSLPNMIVACPGDAMEVRAALDAALRHRKPVFIRIGKKNEPVIHEKVPEFTIGRALKLKEGDDVAILSTGTVLPVAAEAAQMLEETGIGVQLVSVPFVKPLDADALTEAFTRKVVVTVEEHTLLGGFGSAVAEWMADNQRSGKLLRVGTSDEFLHACGSQAYARHYFGITAERIVERVRNAL